MMQIKEYLKKIDQVIENGIYKDNWESLSQIKIPAWFQKGRFGIFIHWGVYSVPARESEWYPRLMYLEGTKSNAHKKATYGENADYRQIVELFNPERFVADEWVKLFKQSGAQYIMPVGEHHDGIKMYKSELNRWNTMELKPHRDFMQELHEACDKNGMGFLISNHRAEHYWFLNGARKNYPDSEVLNEAYRDLYGPAYLGSDGDVENRYNIDISEEWLEDWLASACEMIDRNQPLGVYFDWWVHRSAFRPYIKKFLAYYYNRGLEWGKEVCVFYKMDGIMKDCAVFDVERGQISDISPVLWQCDTAIPKNSWGYTENNDFKTPYEVVTNLIDVISKNGCFMINVGPRADGTICDEEKAVLTAVGDWMQINGEAIYDAHPFKWYGEGTNNVAGYFQETNSYTTGDYRFTYKPGVIYVFAMSEKAGKDFEIKRLCRDDQSSGGIRYNIQSIEVLGESAAIQWVHDEQSLKISADRNIGGQLPLCFKIKID